MKINYDKEVDALYVGLQKGKVSKTVKRGDGFMIDLDRRGKVLGFEVLHYLGENHSKERMQVSVGQRKIAIPAM